jgi:prepilin-type N-terminal cleavage/methylation domain-containing protein
MRSRAGFTLLETAIVLAVMAVGAVLVAPAIARLGSEQRRQPAAELLALLRDARRTAIDQNIVVTLRLDPVSGHYRADTSGVSGAGVMADGVLQLEASETLEARLLRFVWVFRPTGAAQGDTVLVRAANQSVMVSVDQWSGVAHADSR